MTQLAPASELILHLTVRNYGTKCTANKWKCHKNKFNCSEMCGCENCENDDKYDEILLES